MVGGFSILPIDQVSHVLNDLRSDLRFLILKSESDSEISFLHAWPPPVSLRHEVVYSQIYYRIPTCSEILGKVHCTEQHDEGGDAKAPSTIPLLLAYLYSFQEQFAHAVFITKLIHTEERNMVVYQNHQLQKTLNRLYSKKNFFFFLNYKDTCKFFPNSSVATRITVF